MGPRPVDLAARACRAGAIWGRKIPEVPDRVYAGEIEYREVARLARDVAALAIDGDVEARDIVAGAAADFAVDVAAAIDRLDWEREPILVGTLGKIFRAGAVYRDPFREALERLTPRPVILANPRLSGLGGAALLALREGHIAATPSLVDALAAQGMGGDDA